MVVEEVIPRPPPPDFAPLSPEALASEVEVVERLSAVPREVEVVERVAAVPPTAEAEVASPPAEPPAPPPAAPAPGSRRVERTPVPEVLVRKTVWHPLAARRQAVVEVAGQGEPLELREGDAVGPLVVREISPSGVVFLHEGVELRRRVGANP
jgi:hypothetical protein